MSEHERPDWLASHLENLPAELEPDRDLWPGIGQRLTRPANTRRHTAALAATLLISTSLALFAWQSHRAAQFERTATAAMIAELLQPYERIHAEQASRWRAVRASLHPDVMDTLEDDMHTLNEARDTLEGALVEAPTDPALHALLLQVIARERELIETGARLGGDYL